jgi:hypothetical protein
MTGHHPKTKRESRDNKMPILRLCNRLLGRLSRASEPQLCAAVLLFLAQVFPLNERSGLNIMVRCAEGSTHQLGVALVRQWRSWSGERRATS